MKDRKIVGRSWVRADGERVNFDDLPPEKRTELATAWKVEYLNAIYAGRAVFHAADREGEEKIWLP